jgi:TatD DNase family protein
MPPDRVLTETDGPFATISGKPLQPADCSDALKVLSQLWSIDANAVRAKIVASFKALVSAQS